MLNNKAFENLLRRGLPVLLLLMLTACNKQSSEQESSQFASLNTDISCVIAMTPHQGEGISDQRIQDLQKRLLTSQYNLAQLENLGWAYVNKAQTSFDPGFYKLAEQTVACMNMQRPESLSAQLIQGHVLHSQHRFKEAQFIAKKLVENRGYWYDFGLLGDAMMEQGELDSAILAYQEMMNQNPGSQAYNRAAHVRWLKGDIEGAIELLRLSANTPGASINGNWAWAMTRLAEYQLQSGRIDVSLNLLSALLEMRADYAPALLLQGRIKLAQGLIDPAIEDLSHALQLNPLPEYRWALIEALSEKDGTQQRLRLLKQQMLQSAEIEDSRTFALYLATTGHDSDRAVTLAKQELQLRQDVVTLDVYAWALRANDQHGLARQFSIQSLKEGTQSARLFYHAGVIAAESKRIEDAKKFLRQAKLLENNLWPSERRHLNQFCDSSSHCQLM